VYGAGAYLALVHPRSRLPGRREPDVRGPRRYVVVLREPVSDHEPAGDGASLAGLGEVWGPREAVRPFSDLGLCLRLGVIPQSTRVAAVRFRVKVDEHRAQHLLPVLAVVQVQDHFVSNVMRPKKHLGKHNSASSQSCQFK
jgi:hypothetical protein